MRRAVGILSILLAIFFGAPGIVLLFESPGEAKGLLLLCAIFGLISFQMIYFGEKRS